MPEENIFEKERSNIIVPSWKSRNRSRMKN
jgi:hypothetical protein